MNERDVVATLGDKNVGILLKVDYDGLKLLRMSLQNVQHVLGSVVLEMLEFCRENF